MVFWIIRGKRRRKVNDEQTLRIQIAYYPTIVIFDYLNLASREAIIKPEKSFFDWRG